MNCKIGTILIFAFVAFSSASFGSALNSPNSECPCNKKTVQLPLCLCTPQIKAFFDGSVKMACDCGNQKDVQTTTTIKPFVFQETAKASTTISFPNETQTTTLTYEIPSTFTFTNNPITATTTTITPTTSTTTQTRTPTTAKIAIVPYSDLPRIENGCAKCGKELFTIPLKISICESFCHNACSVECISSMLIHHQEGCSDECSSKCHDNCVKFTSGSVYKSNIQALFTPHISYQETKVESFTTSSVKPQVVKMLTPVVGASSMSDTRMNKTNLNNNFNSPNLIAYTPNTSSAKDISTTTPQSTTVLTTKNETLRSKESVSSTTTDPVPPPKPIPQPHLINNSSSIGEKVEDPPIVAKVDTCGGKCRSECFHICFKFKHITANQIVLCVPQCETACIKSCRH